MMNYKKLMILVPLLAFFSLTRQGCAQPLATLQVGAERLTEYLPMIGSKKVGLIVNQTSLVGNSHLLDTLLAIGVQVTAIFAPEHGYRGNVERGKSVGTTVDSLTGIPVYSIYGSRKKPRKEDMRSVEVMLFDMQDVGVRFFT